MSCSVCDAKVKFKCGATPKCKTVYCSQLCGDEDLEQHICSQFIGSPWDMLKRDNLVSILYELPLDQLWRLCATEERISRICKGKMFRIGYLKQREPEEIQPIVDRALGKVGNTVVLNEWFKDILDSDMYYPTNFSIKWASRSGYTDVVRLLLEDGRAEVPAQALITASMNGHVDVVRLLLQDGRVNPAADNNNAIRNASIRGHADVVRLLLQDERVNPAAHGNEAIIWASAKGHVDVVRLLLQDERVNPAADNNNALRLARARGQADVVELLIQDPRVDPSTV